MAFVIYLIPGTLKTPWWQLDLLSGIAPPEFYSIYEKPNECPLGLDCYKDFETGLAVAKKENKPILLDFTGWACSNCRRVEEKVWSDPKVFKILQDEYVLISLYVDDRKELPKEQQFTFLRDMVNTKRIKTIGNKWATFQAVNFGVTAQPYYVLMSPDLSILNREEDYKNGHKRFLLRVAKTRKDSI